MGEAETGSALVNEAGSTMGDLVRQVQRVAVADLINEWALRRARKNSVPYPGHEDLQTHGRAR